MNPNEKARINLNATYLIEVLALGTLLGVLDNGDAGRGDHNTLNLGAVELSGPEDTSGTVDGGASDLRGVLPGPDDGRSGVDDGVDVLDGLVVGTGDLNVGDNDVGDLSCGVSGFDVLGLGLLADAG
jgi:hypothetical protein